MNCFSQKIVSIELPRQALAFFSNTVFYQYQLQTTFVIIDSRTNDYFFANKNLISNYRKYLHLFETKLGKKVTT